MRLTPTPIPAICREIIQTVFLLPVWWYTEGLRDIAQSCWRELRDCRKLLQLGILVRHLWSPLYGYYDWEMRLVSFPIRLVHFTCYLVMTLAFATFYLLVFLLWLLIPMIVVSNIVYQLGLTTSPFDRVLWHTLFVLEPHTEGFLRHLISTLSTALQ